MNPIIKYSLECGVTPSAPHISRSFFPIQYENYALIENQNRDKYLCINELCHYLTPYLNQNNIKLIQIKSSSSDESIDGVEVLSQYSLSQLNYIIEKSGIVISNSPYTLDVAKTLKVNRVSTANSSNEFSENITSKALDIYKIKHDLDLITPIFCGHNFHKKILEIVPDFDISQTNIKNQSVNIRGDYHFNEKNILNCILLNTSNLITSKVPRLSMLPPHIIQKNLIQINLEATESTTQQDIDNIKSHNVKVNIFSRDKSNIQKIRLNLIDEQVELDEMISKKDLDIGPKICNNTIYKSSKMIISKNKFYTSKASWEKDKPLQENNPHFVEKIIDSSSFWHESEHFKLLNINHG